MLSLQLNFAAVLQGAEDVSLLFAGDEKNTAHGREKTSVPFFERKPAEIFMRIFIMQT